LEYKDEIQGKGKSKFDRDLRKINSSSASIDLQRIALAIGAKTEMACGLIVVADSAGPGLARALGAAP
jgi:hypothetical protein